MSDRIDIDELDFEAAAEAIAERERAVITAAAPADPVRAKIQLQERKARWREARRLCEQLEERGADVRKAEEQLEQARVDGYTEQSIGALEAEVARLTDQPPAATPQSAPPSAPTGSGEAAGDQTAARLEIATPIAKHMWRGAHWERRGKNPSCIKKPLTEKHLLAHVSGTGPAIGLAPIKPGTDTTRIALLDADSHKGEVSWEEMVACIRPILAGLQRRGLNAVAMRSSGGQGMHIVILWDTEQDAYSVRRLLEEVLHEHGFKNGVGGVAKGEIEVFPKQDRVQPNGCGSMFILFGAGDSALLDPETLAPIDIPAGYSLPTSSPVAKRERPAPLEREHVVVSTDLAELKTALEKIPNEDDKSLDYDAWWRVIAGIHDATGGSTEGLALAHEFSARSAKYDAAFLDERVWPYIRSEGREKAITAATIFDMARAADPVADLAMFDELPQEPAGGTTEAPKRFEILDDLEARRSRAPLTWIIKTVLPRAELAVMYGEPGSGKSFAALDMAAAIARGIEWRGLRTKKLRVLYVAAEGAAGFLWRLEAYCRANAIERIGMGVIADAPNLHKGPDANALLAQIKARGQVDLVVIDTLSAVSPGANENTSEDMGRVLSTCKKIARETGATILLIHHSGKDQTRGSRGWSGIKGAVDAELEVLRDGELRQIRALKEKDARDGAVFQFKLRVIGLGHDEDGDPVTSCVLEHLAEGSEPELKPGRKGTGRVAGLGGREALVLRVAHDLVSLGGDTVSMDALIDHAALQIEHDPAKRDRRREHTVRAVGSLREKGLLAVEDEVVRLTTDGERKASAGVK